MTRQYSNKRFAARLADTVIKLRNWHTPAGNLVGVSLNDNKAIRIDCFDDWSKHSLKPECPK